MTTKTRFVAICMGLALSACGTVDNDIDDDAGATPADTEGQEESSGGPIAPPPADTDSGPASDESTEGGETESDTNGCNFLCPPDGGPDGVIECDVFTQDCPSGEKCMPWANDGGSSWNATKCVPISDNPGQPGDECEVEGSGVSGLDDCDISAMCWNVDPETNVGSCIAMCSGDLSAPICDDPDTSCSITNDGVLILCLPNCDPLLQDCSEGEACYPVNDGWNCAPDASGEMGLYGDPCEFINVCDPGLICLGAAATPGCAGSGGCCTEVCDIADPAGDAQCSGQAGGQTCQPWYEEGASPPGYEDVGACALPA